MVATLSKLFRWAVSRDLIPFSPVADVAKPSKETKRDRTLDDGEIVLVWRAGESLAYPFSQFFRLALAPGQRRDEIGGMTLDERDLTAGLWTLAGARTKWRLGAYRAAVAAGLAADRGMPAARAPCSDDRPAPRLAPATRRVLGGCWWLAQIHLNAPSR